MGQLRFEDLQPHVDMLCDALENKGASSSGIPNLSVYPFAEQYRDILTRIRAKQITFEDLLYELHLIKHQTIEASKGNQEYRIGKIVHALDIFIMKEYSKITHSLK